ncbi:MAG: hypothetical protein HC927_13195 [Deltaproteobacteria bacterium]|nr:hypothetical protein [Deltaproteobacteria bacterium]
MTERHIWIGLIAAVVLAVAAIETYSLMTTNGIGVADVFPGASVVGYLVAWFYARRTNADVADKLLAWVALVVLTHAIWPAGW